MDGLESMSARGRPVADWRVAARRVPGGPDGVVELARLMAKECPPMLAAIRSALEARDASAASISAHKLQGAARYFGAAQVVSHASDVERWSREGRIDDASRGLDALDRAVVRLVAVLADVKADTVREALAGSAEGGG